MTLLSERPSIKRSSTAQRSTTQRSTTQRSTTQRSTVPDTRLSAALVAISHGTNSADGQAAIAALVTAVALARPELGVTSGFVDVQQPDVATSLGALRTDCVGVVVPLLLSAGYHVHVDLHRETRAHDRVTTVSRALGPDDRLIDVLAQRLHAAGFAAGPDQEIVLAAAGSSDERAVEDCRRVGALLEQRLGVRVTVGFLSAAAPRLACAVTGARLRSGRVTVSTYLMAPGFFFDLARTQSAGAELITAPLLLPGETAPVPLVDLVIDRYLEAKEQAGLF